MPQHASAINSALLVWARERAGLSLHEVAARLGRDTSVIEAWETGASAPTYGQLEKLAEKVYQRPVALFFLPEPPEEAPLRTEFRTLPDADLDGLGADTRYALRDAHAFQTSLRELTGGENPAPRRILDDVHSVAGESMLALAVRTREYLGVSLQEQQRWASTEAAMSCWRAALEAVGVFVFKRSFREREVSGFCLHDADFPLIVINNTTPFSRQVFTLFHELAHLLIGVSSISKEDPSLMARFAPADRQLEMACNQFAAELLVPDSSVRWADFRASSAASFIESTAGLYSVSREVVLRRLRDRGLISAHQYGKFVEGWTDDPVREGGGGRGGSYYATQSAYLSRAFVNLAFAQFRAGRITLPDISEHLRMRAPNVLKFEDYLFGRG
jgi:Zn-dependent peptidase ImmA (M78 family)/transcriptional regulator with XRE-family HTH domain